MENNENKPYLNWGFLRKFNEEDLTINLSISEFIDNSISNYEQYKENFDNDLEIKIYYFNNEKKYLIIDNANGIEDLKSSMETFKDAFDKIPNSKNQYGYGMKSAIFWLGKWGTLYTKHNDKIMQGTYVPDTNSNYLEMSDEEISKFDVKYDIKQITNDEVPKQFKEHKHGTCIEIKDVYPYRGLNDNSKNLEELKKFLGFRFGNYVDSNNLNNFQTSISIIIMENENTKKNSFAVNRESLLDAGTNLGEFNKNNEEWLELKKKAKSDSKFQYEKLKTYYEKLFSNEKLSFYIEIPMIINNSEYKLPMRLVIINTNNSRKHKNLYKPGISIIHSNRYIFHPGANDKDNNLYPFYKNVRDFESHWKWLYAEIELEKIPLNNKCDYIRPDKNKRNIIFKHSDIISKELFEKTLHDFLESIDPFIKFLVFLNKNISEKQTTYESFENTNNIDAKDNTLIENAKFDIEKKQLITNRDDDKILKFLLPTNNNKLIIQIVESNEDFLIRNIKSNNDFDINYEYNLLNKWTNPDTNLPNMILLLAYLDIGLYNKEKHQWNNVNDFLSEILKVKKG